MWSVLACGVACGVVCGRRDWGSSPVSPAVG